MRAKKHLLILIFPLLLAACGGHDYSVADPPMRLDSVDISEVVVNLPAKEGKEITEMDCVPCHSLRYLEMQPEMSKKSWEKIVTKMIKSFGAPVRDSVDAEKIVEYLVAMKK